jgi:tRNA threonylcarbamoyladenosine biosynthesis protein TsaB
LKTLAIDTSERRGSLAVRRDGRTVATRLHHAADYSSWLLGAVADALSEAGTTMESIELLAVATGPGSFTGVRVGLTTVKAWAEVYGKPVVGVSRLEALAGFGEHAGMVAASYDAQRGQIFAGLYRWVGGLMEAVEREMVVAPDSFVNLVYEKVRQIPVQWVSMDPEVIASQEGWAARNGLGDRIILAPPDVASLIGEQAEERASRGEFTDPLELDANYVRPSDAEIFWKGPSSYGIR